MDMSVRLNASYPAPAAAAAQQEKTAEQGASEQAYSVSSLAAVAKDQKEPDAAELQEAVRGLQDYVQSLQRNLEFSLDDSTGKVVVKVVARDSGEVIRQIPSQTALELAKSLQSVNSLLFDEKV